MKIEFKREEYEGKRCVVAYDGENVAAGSDGHGYVSERCREELAKWNAEEPEKLERYTREELFELYNAKKDTLKRKVRDPFIDVKASLESVATAVLEREAAIFAQMSEEELVNKVAAEIPGSASLRGKELALEESPNIIALVRQFDAAKKEEVAIAPGESLIREGLEPQLGPGWRPMGELKGLRGDEEVLPPGVE